MMNLAVVTSQSISLLLDYINEEIKFISSDGNFNFFIASMFYRALSASEKNYQHTQHQQDPSGNKQVELYFQDIQIPTPLPAGLTQVI